MLQPISVEEKEWLQSLKAGKQIALQRIFNHYYKYLVVTGYNITGDNEKAKDLVQDVFYELWKKREKLDIQSSLKSYLRRAVVNRSLNYIKTQKRFDFGDENFDAQTPDQTVSAQKTLEAQDLKSALNKAINGLPAKCKAIFMLSRYEKLSHKEIAAKLDISTKTIENQITKALKIVRAAVEKYDALGLLILLLNIF
ncbi:MAG: RNA polymerase sigma factor [Saprospiraceae bacterium]